MKVNKFIIISILFIFFSLLIMDKAFAYNIPLTIDSNGNITHNFSKVTVDDIPSKEYIVNSYELNNNKLTLKSASDRYYLDINKELVINSTNNVNLYMTYTNHNLTIDTEKEVSIGLLEDTTNSKKLTIKNAKINKNGCLLKNFLNLNLENVEGSISNYQPSSSNNVDASLTIKDSNIIFQTSYSIKTLNIDNSIVDLGVLNGNDLKFNINKSTIRFNALYPNQKKKTTSIIKESEINKGTIMPRSDYLTTIDIEDSTINNTSIYYSYIIANNSNLNFSPSFSVNDFKNSTINFNNINVVGLNLDNCEVNADLIYLQTQDKAISSYVMKNSKINIKNAFQFILNADSSYENIEINAPQGFVYIGQSSIKNSTIKALRYGSANSNQESTIENSTIKANEFCLSCGGGKYNIINSNINTSSFEAGNAYINILKSKIISHNYSIFKLLNFKHSYFLTDIDENNNTGKSNVRILNYDNSIDFIVTDLKNNIIEPNDKGISCDSQYPELCNNSVFTEYSNVLLRDKLNITFKIVNGKWSDGTTNDIVLEKYAFDKLLEEDIPKNMIPNDGYDKGILFMTI